MIKYIFIKLFGKMCISMKQITSHLMKLIFKSIFLSFAKLKHFFKLIFAEILNHKLHYNYYKLLNSYVDIMSSASILVGGIPSNIA